MEGPSDVGPLAPAYAQLLGRGSTGVGGDGRSVFLTTQMRLREKEYTNSHAVTVFVGSWNVNGKSPKEALAPWLLQAGHVPDVVALGLQEFDMSTSALILSETAKVEPWIAAMGATLNRLPELQYVLLAKQQLGGILETVWIRRELAVRVRDLQIHYSSTGIGNVLANKGGTAIRLDIFDSSFCFVCAHLNAHDENVLRRNQDFASIVSDVRFSDGRSIWDHQFLFWFGDLNYRIALPRARIFALIEGENWKELVANDQLNEQRRLGCAFSEFAEGKIAWAPTYRYDAGTNTYDTSEKQRKPSYTDRVLHKTENAEQLKLLEYNRVSQLMLSDHKPVFAVYASQVREIRPADYQRVFASVSRDMDKLENDYQPQATVSTLVLDFDQVRYGTPATQKLTLTNTGVVLFRWRFIAKPNQSGGSGVCKPWAHVEPASGTLMPNESVDISGVVLVEGSEIAAELGLGRDKLDDILVLHLENGKDYFISLQGRYLQSCFGCLLDQLVRIPQPIRSASNLLKPEDSLRIPKELWLLADWLYRHGLNEPDVFLQRGIPDEMAVVREFLDTGVGSIPATFSPHSIAETLLDFLRALAQPVIPIVYYAQAIEPNAQHAFCKQIVEALPEANYNVFYYLVALGREVLTRPRGNGVTPDELALAFGQAVLRPPNEPRYKKANVVEQHDMLKMRFFKRFLVDAAE
jgi:phosphatidylinositol-bisphosphatase